MTETYQHAVRHWVRNPEPDPVDMAPIVGTTLMLGSVEAEIYEQERAKKQEQVYVPHEYDSGKHERHSAAAYRACGNGTRRGGFGVSRD